MFRGRDPWNFMVSARPDRVLALALGTFSDGQTVPSGVNRGLAKTGRSNRSADADQHAGMAFSQNERGQEPKCKITKILPSPRTDSRISTVRKIRPVFLLLYL